MSSSDALTDCLGHKARRPLSIPRYGVMRFGPFYVAETDSNRPEYFARLLTYLRRKGKSREDAEDLIQEAMLRLHIYAKGDAVVNKEAFLRRAVHNLAIDQYRRDRSGLRREVPIEEVNRLSPLMAPGPTPDQIIENQQRLDCLTALLDATDPRTREIYFAHRSGYTYAEIADDMDIAEITVRRHIARAHTTIMSLTVQNGYSRAEKRCRVLSDTYMVDPS